MDEPTDASLDALLADARQDPDVLGVFLFGSRVRDGFADDRSDYDVGVVISEESALAAFDERWPYRRGAQVEVASSTVAQLRDHGEYGSPSEWARYQYSQAKILLDKTGEVETVIQAKERVPDAIRPQLVRDSIDGYVNSTHRSLRNRMVGLVQSARLDAAESLPYLLTAIFALDARVRPFNKYLEWELCLRPLSDPTWAADKLLPQVAAVLDGDDAVQRSLFRDLEHSARQRGFNETLDGWEPDLAWLRGDAGYRG